MATAIMCQTETWIADDAKLGLIGKQLRDWMVAQIMWADDVRLSMLRSADYLNAGTNEVEAASQIYEMTFPLIQKTAHFLFNFFLVVWLSKEATPLFLIMVPAAIYVQLSRCKDLTAKLDFRQKCERLYVSTLSGVLRFVSVWDPLDS